MDKTNNDNWSELLRFPILSVYAGKLEMEAKEDTILGV